MKTYNAKDTINHVTYLLETKQKFAFVTYTRSAIMSVLNEIGDEKKPPKSFTKSVLDGLQKKDKSFIKAVQNDLAYSALPKLEKVGVKLDHVYDPGFLESYINTNIDIFKTFMNWYVRNTKSIIVSFQAESHISRHFSHDSKLINVPYNDFYSRIDSIVASVKEHESDAYLCVLDCPMLGAALAPRIWDATNLSVLDLGRTLNVVKNVARQNDFKK
jgi:hypothetical protein